MNVRGITKRFGAIRALDEVSFDVRAGELLGLIGPNGAGKTTLLECVAGALAPDAGFVCDTAGGQPWTETERVRKMFYLPDAIAPWPGQTVRWALDFVIGFLDGRAPIRDQVVHDLAIETFLDQRIGTLSKGQRKRAMLAIGLLAPQPTLLCDEPFDGLDLKQTREIGAALRRHAAGGRTLLLSIHQIADAARLCDRFVLLSAGRVCGMGTVDELAARAGNAGLTHDLSEVFLALT